jgi:hypothetical protein
MVILTVRADYYELSPEEQDAVALALADELIARLVDRSDGLEVSDLSAQL